MLALLFNLLGEVFKCYCSDCGTKKSYSEMKEYYLPHIVHSHSVFFVLFILEQMLELESCSQFLSFNQYI